MTALFTKKTQVIRARHDLHALLNALADGRVPDDLKAGSYEIEIPPNEESTSPDYTDTSETRDAGHGGVPW